MNALLIDIGNTRVKWRFAELGGDHDPSSSAGDADGAAALDDVARIADRWHSVADRPVDAALISNVAHAGVEAVLTGAVSAYWPAARIERIVATEREGGLVNRYDDPARLGPDRWLALIGGHALMPRRSLLVCTFGTATTIDLMTVAPSDEPGSATFVGGLILPGFAAMRGSLAVTTARLTDADGSVAHFATDTVDCIASGIAAAQWGAVERAIAHARSLHDAEPLTCLFAGGALPEIAALLETLETPHRVVPDLVLRGLTVVAARRRPATRTERSSERSSACPETRPCARSS